MVTFLLIRHAASSTSNGILTGRMPGVHLSSDGVSQARILAKLLVPCSVTEVWSSPLERAEGTAKIIANETHTRVRLSDNLNEVDYGDWTGQSFETLRLDRRWHDFNRSHMTTLIPNGERLIEVRQRVISHLRGLTEHKDSGTIAVITHAEPIRLVVAQLLGASDAIHERLQISPASVTAVRWSLKPVIIAINLGIPFERILSGIQSA
jgi:broad specificity phosphatase PhoE